MIYQCRACRRVAEAQGEMLPAPALKALPAEPVRFVIPVETLQHSPAVYDARPLRATEDGPAWPSNGRRRRSRQPRATRPADRGGPIRAWQVAGQQHGFPLIGVRDYLPQVSAPSRCTNEKAAQGAASNQGQPLEYLQQSLRSCGARPSRTPWKSC